MKPAQTPDDSPRESSDKLIVITGPTASGKSTLAMELAEVYGGEIICADSRTVYRGMDIVTAKPSLQDQRQVPHHLLDIVDPDQKYTAANFQRDARRAISEIRSRRHVPFVVGGTGLYIDGLILDYKFDSDKDTASRSHYEALTVEALQKLLKNRHIPLPRNEKNKRHLVRALQQGGINNNRNSKPSSNTLVVAITTSKDELDERISSRAVQMFKEGVVEEASRLAKHYGWDHESMTGNIYPILHRYLSGDISLEDATQLFIRKDKQLVKRQLTWLKRHDYVRWLSLDEAKVFIADYLDAR